MCVGNGVISLRFPEKMAINGGKITLSVKWARSILKSMIWVNRRGTTAKRGIKQLLRQVSLHLEEKIL